MKRIKIWLKSFNLIEQFLSVTLATVFLFVIFFFTFLQNNINDFINNQMISYLHRYEEHYVSSESYNYSYSDANVDSYVYSLKQGVYLNKIPAKNQRVIENINPIVSINLSGEMKIGDVTHFYSVIELKDPNYLLISILSNDYVNGFKSTLTQSVINIVIFVCLGLFTFFLIWIGTLISPLKSIRNYIEKYKIGEKASLEINRNDEIGEVAEAITSMNDELAKQQRIREEMVQNISHDLKTPIATIKSYSESIKDGIYPYDTLEKSVDVIIEHANRLEKKAYNLNTFNKLEYLSDSDTDTLMSEVIEKAILSLEAIRSDINIETDINNKVYFHGEEEAWRTVVENLIDNALRYAKSLVKIHLTKNMLEVFNDGELMSKDRIDKLFKPYEKGTKGNFGLGLSIVKKVCDTYGYTVIGGNMDDGVIFRIISNRTHKKAKKQESNKSI